MQYHNTHRKGARLALPHLNTTFCPSGVFYAGDELKDEILDAYLGYTLLNTMGFAAI